jgi:DNA helicase IV
MAHHPASANSRPFKLPDYRELSKEQDKVLRLPNNGVYLIKGAPGTGKTVMTLLRAMNYAKRSLNYRYIVYYRVLECMTRQLSREVSTQTFHSFFYNRFAELYNTKPPEKSKFVYDWEKIEDIYYDLAKRNNEFIIIDEGQDLPKQFYTYLSDHCRHIFVAADENQGVTDERSTISDIRGELKYDRKPDEFKELELRGNYRNTLQIAKLAETFYCDTDAEPPELPRRQGSIPWLYGYERLDTVCYRIAERARRFPAKLTGIITWDNDSLMSYTSNILKFGVSVQTYTSQTRGRPDIRFNKGGVVILNSPNIKGLEFDTVFIADLHKFPVYTESQKHKMLMYVMTTRAKDDLFILTNRHQPCPMLDLLPDDPEILRRKGIVQ